MDSQRHPASSQLKPPSHVSQSRQADGELLYKVRFDPVQGIIHASAHGFWTLEEVDGYLAHLARFMQYSRSTAGKVQVLVDRRASHVQRAEVALRFAEFNRQHADPNDRVAVVVDSVLFKGQVSRQSSGDGSRAFLSIVEAEGWLATA